MRYQDWLEAFDALEKGRFGRKLEGDSRHPTLYRLFGEGYSPQRAVDLVEQARIIELLLRFIWPVAILGIVGLGALIGAGIGWHGDRLFGAMALSAAIVFFRKLYKHMALHDALSVADGANDK